MIVITETKQQVEEDFITNVDIDGYCVYTQPSKSNAGGVALYVNNRLDHLERIGLGKLDDDFESIWIEIKNKKGKNFLCGCLYRHPNTDTAKFMEYIESTLTKIDKNKYAVFLIGDFNIDLLKYESHNCTNDFINSLVSHSFLPYILQQTRMTDHSSTITDNIVSNITDYETSSGNITNLIADHFAQFLIIKKFTLAINPVAIPHMTIPILGKKNLFMTLHRLIGHLLMMLIFL